MTASVLAASTSGCFMRAEKVPQNTARITVNHQTRTSHALTCTQVQWLWTADISAAPAHVKTVLRLDGEAPKPESVDIDNFEGFTGVANSGVGDAKVVFANNTYTVTGKAQGTDPDDVSEPAIADFKIEVSC
ncbi:hypothetical protein AWC26_15545 [Mycobacterium shimoidei]|nr:hypothetical protein BHQ16_02130 [Mycobacterium shimoidei]ORW79037.1 hypothetical protein AWC26_15545 [Mycobacterium shimoidei]